MMMVANIYTYNDDGDARPGKKGAMKKNEQIKTKKIIRIYSSRFIFGTNRVYRPAHCSMND